MNESIYVEVKQLRTYRPYEISRAGVRNIIFRVKEKLECMDGKLVAWWRLFTFRVGFTF